VLKKVTITLSEEAARWVRVRAAEQNTSVSRLVGQMLEDQMLEEKMSQGDRTHSPAYQEAYRQWREIKPMGLDADHRMTREEAHERL
jgi:hypothetical protein